MLKPASKATGVSEALTLARAGRAGPNKPGGLSLLTSAATTGVGVFKPALRLVGRRSRLRGKLWSIGSKGSMPGNCHATDGSNACSGGSNAWSDGSNAWSDGSNAWSGGSNAWSDGSNAWSDGSNAWFSGNNAWFSGNNAWFSGNNAWSGGSNAWFAGGNSSMVGSGACFHRSKPSPTGADCLPGGTGPSRAVASHCPTGNRFSGSGWASGGWEFALRVTGVRALPRQTAAPICPRQRRSRKRHGRPRRCLCAWR